MANADIDELRAQLAEMRRRLDSIAEKRLTVAARRRRSRPAQRKSGFGGARLVDFRAAEEMALEIVDFPFAEQSARFGVLDPFGDGFDAQMARKFGEGAHEEAIVDRARDVLHERAVDLDDVDAEAAQIAERRVSGAEIVHRDGDAERFHMAEDARGLVDRLDRQRFDDFHDQSLRRFPDGSPSAAFKRSIQSGARKVATEMLTATLSAGSAARRSSASSSTR